MGSVSRHRSPALLSSLLHKGPLNLALLPRHLFHRSTETPVPVPSPSQGPAGVNRPRSRGTVGRNHVFPAEIPTSRGAGGAPTSTGHCPHCASALPFLRGEPGRIPLLPKEFCSAKGIGFWVVFPTPRLMAGIKQSHMSHFRRREDQTLRTLHWG